MAAVYKYGSSRIHPLSQFVAKSIVLNFVYRVEWKNLRNYLSFYRGITPTRISFQSFHYRDKVYVKLLCWSTNTKHPSILFAKPRYSCMYSSFFPFSYSCMRKFRKDFDFRVPTSLHYYYFEVLIVYLFFTPRIQRKRKQTRSSLILHVMVCKIAKRINRQRVYRCMNWKLGERDGVERRIIHGQTRSNYRTAIEHVRNLLAARLSRFRDYFHRTRVINSRTMVRRLIRDFFSFHHV